MMRKKYNDSQEVVNKKQEYMDCFRIIDELGTDYDEISKIVDRMTDLVKEIQQSK